MHNNTIQKSANVFSLVKQSDITEINLSMINARLSNARRFFPERIPREAWREQSIGEVGIRYKDLVPGKEVSSRNSAQ